MLIPGAAVTSSPSPTAVASKTTKFSVPNSEDKGTIKTEETLKADNIPAKNYNINQLQQDSDYSYSQKANQGQHSARAGEKQAPKQVKINQNKTKSDSKYTTSGADQATNESQPVTTLITADIAKDITGKTIAKNNINSTQEQTVLQNALKTSIVVPTRENTQLTSVSDQNGITKNTNSDQTLMIKSQAENKIITSTISQSQAKPSIALSNSQVGDGKNKGETELSYKISSAIKKPVNQGNKTEATAEILNTDSQKSNSGEKQLSAGDSTISGAQKSFILTQSTPTVDNKQSNAQQNMSAATTKTSSKNDESANDKTDATQNGRTPLDSNSGKDKIHANSAATETITKDLNIEQIRISTNQSKDSNNPPPDNNSGQVFKQIISSNNLQSLLEGSSAPSSSAKAVDTALPSDVSTSVSKQIQESIYSSLRHDQQQITIRLNPPELGKVSIKFQEQNGQITGLMEVSNTQTKIEIQRALPEIIQNLQENGIQVKQVNVISTNQREQPAFREQSLAGQHNSEAGQQNPPNSNNQRNYPAWTAPNDWQTSIEGYGVGQPYARITKDFIDVLA